MDDFMKSLQGLNAADLNALGVAASAHLKTEARGKDGDIPRGCQKRTASPSRAARPRPGDNRSKPSAGKTTAPPIANTLAPAADAATVVGDSAAPSDSTAEPALMASSASASTPTPTATEPDRAPAAPPTRQRPVHEWPPVGAVLEADYFGTAYRAEVVPARKPLKSGKQLKLLDGPARGKRFDSFTRAMLAATAHQRRTMRLDRRGMASGWSFWKLIKKN